jgi:hypothetical protein
MELERCRDYDIDPLVLHQTTPGKAPEPPATIGTMLRNGQIGFYSSPAERNAAIAAYLRG